MEVSLKKVKEPFQKVLEVNKVKVRMNMKMKATVTKVAEGDVKEGLVGLWRAIKVTMPLEYING